MAMADPNPNPNPNPIPSSFLHPPPLTSPSQTPVIVHLRRDQLTPLALLPPNQFPNETLNTRFGHFPHRTLLNVPLGSQVRASTPNSIYKQKQEKKKRKRVSEASGARDYQKHEQEDAKGQQDAAGFVHVLNPTPELWTHSLPHRTQVVYTPDSSYILQRLRVRPGTRIIEAGAGSGSFTHAAVRVVYNGYPNEEESVEVVTETQKGRKRGKVFSYEYHEARAKKLRDEIESHGLKGLVEITSGDVCKEGFRLKTQQAINAASPIPTTANSTKPSSKDNESPPEEDYMEIDTDRRGLETKKDNLLYSNESPEATAIFLDLPAPWLAIPHLTRHNQPPPTPLSIPSISSSTTPVPEPLTATSPSNPTPPLTDPKPAWGPLHPTLPIQICTFSPCIEQIHRSASKLRQLSWTDLTMVEVQHKKVEVHRHPPYHTLGGEGTFASVEDALAKLKKNVSLRRVAAAASKYKNHSQSEGDNGNCKEEKIEGEEEEEEQEEKEEEKENNSSPQLSSKLSPSVVLTTRSEPELKTHTSYLLFATLPPPWTERDEEDVKRKVEEEKERYVQDPDKTGLSSWKKEKDAKRARMGGGRWRGYGKEGQEQAAGGEGEASNSQKGETRKERKRRERGERFAMTREVGNCCKRDS